jgi:DedD protein
VNDILKQRLVGALILVALGVVFWPIIFVEPGDKAVAQQTRIPPRPDVVTTPIEVPDLAGLRASPERAVPAETEPVEPPAPEPELTVDVIEKESVEKTSAPAVDKPAPGPIITPKPAERTRSEPPQKLAGRRWCTGGLDSAGGQRQ